MLAVQRGRLRDQLRVLVKDLEVVDEAPKAPVGEARGERGRSEEGLALGVQYPWGQFQRLTAKVVAERAARGVGNGHSALVCGC